MDISISSFDGIAIVRVSGAVDGNAAAFLYEALVKCVGDGRTRMIVDLSGVGG